MVKTKFRKFGAFYITDVGPSAGDKMVCVQRKNFSYGKTHVVSEAQIKGNVMLDLVNWKVCITREEASFAKELVQDAKTLQKEYKKMSVHWELHACLDSVIENQKRVVFPMVRAYAFSQIIKD